MAARTPPAIRWACTKCGRRVTDGVATGLDPRYATGLCLHGKDPQEVAPERVPLVDEAKAGELVEERRYQAAVRSARRKRLANQDLTATETAAIARWERERVTT